MTATDLYAAEEEVNTLGWLYSLAVGSGPISSPDKGTSDNRDALKPTTLRTHPLEFFPKIDMPFSIVNRNG